jgi:hypothetical protein
MLLKMDLIILDPRYIEYQGTGTHTVQLIPMTRMFLLFLRMAY